jgi:uncharacterized membrane protein YhfC
VRRGEGTDHVFDRIRAGLEQVLIGVRHERPVVMFARAVDAREWFLMQQTLETVLTSRLTKQLHHENVVIVGERRLAEGRRGVEGGSTYA